jgi:hypothetical protein
MVGETISGMGEVREWKMIEGVDSTMIHCKNFSQCHNVPTVQQLKKIF